jgi:hypothetical protein
MREVASSLTGPPGACGDAPAVLSPEGSSLQAVQQGPLLESTLAQHMCRSPSTTGTPYPIHVVSACDETSVRNVSANGEPAGLVKTWPLEILGCAEATSARASTAPREITPTGKLFDMIVLLT